MKTKMKTKMSTRMIVEGGILVGLAVVLSMLKVFQMPNGGSITLGSMVPILFFAMRWGLVPGIISGVAYGLLQFIIEPITLSLLSILLDYIFAFGVLGIAGLFNRDGKITYTNSIIATIVAVFSRFVFHVLSGVYVWYSYAPAGANIWVYSITYNALYLLPEFAITILLVSILSKPVLLRFLPNIATDKLVN